MSRLVCLYPKVWRDRYEAEFLSLLAERPPTFADLVDTIRGALDAHLNPQTHVEPSPWTHRLPGIFALIAGALWFTVFAAFVVWQNGAWAVAILFPVAMLFMLLSLPGDYMATHGRRIAIALGVIGLCILAANLPWSLPTAVAGIGGYLIVLGGMLTLAAIRAEIGPSGRWMLLAVAIVLPVAIGFPIALGLGTISDNETWVLGLLLPYGVAWILIGLRMAIRGSATLIDLPASPTEPEVRAA